jgi:MFS superfamily sulfate permease-like transporter
MRGVSFRGLLSDISASVVVYLVALPLCLGVALASDTLPITGIIAGIIGGIVVGLISKSSLSVSGPAAGLTAIVAGAVGTLPSYNIFLLSLVIAGFFQICFGFLKAGQIADYIPYSIIKGLLAAIGLILILKQIPYFFGFANLLERHELLKTSGNSNLFSAPLQAVRNPDPGALMIGGFSLLILLLFERKQIRNNSFLRYLPASLMAVASGILLNFLFNHFIPGWFLGRGHLVAMPVFETPASLVSALSFPDLSGFNYWETWSVAIVIAVIASIETLLSIEAVDNLDPQKRVTPPNHELKAQGFGNIASGMLGGLPVTSVIVRSSANAEAGAYSKRSTIFHGVLLLMSLLYFSHVLNLIPLSSLSAILIVTGYKLTKPSVYIEMKKRGWEQFVPFLVTVVAILQTDLLKGVFIGLVTGFIFGLRRNFLSAVTVMRDADRLVLKFGKDVSFLNHGLVKNQLRHVGDHMRVYIDVTRVESVDRDIVNLVNTFIHQARQRGISVHVRYSSANKNRLFTEADS